MNRMGFAAAVWLLTTGAALAVSDDINKPLSSPDGTASCTDDPALVNDARTYDPSCVEGGKSLKNEPERGKADVPPRKGSTESPPPPDTGHPPPGDAPGLEPL
jgi:hypothetical protein